MDILRNKVTRRVALGSIAGGLAGTALVLRALKGRYNTDVTNEGKPLMEWGKYVKLLDVPIKQIDGPAKFMLDYKLQVGMKYRIIHLVPSYAECPTVAKYPEQPSLFIATNGSVVVGPPIVDDRPALQIIADKRKSYLHGAFHEFPGGECIAVPNGAIEYFRSRHGLPKRLRIDEVGMACKLLASSIILNYPKGKMLRVGTDWTIPESDSCSIDLPCKIVGFADVAGIETAKVIGERSLNSDEYRKSIIRAVELLEKQRVGDNIVKTMKSRVEQIANEERAIEHHIACYVDLKTGLVVRSENRSIMSTKTNPHLEASEMLSQLLMS